MHLPVHRSWPSTAFAEKQTEKHPRLEYIDTRKVCIEVTRTSCTLRRVYTTPRDVTPAFVFVQRFDCGSSERSKTKRRNAFQYVVLHLSAPSSSDDIAAALGRMQLQKYKYYL